MKDLVRTFKYLRPYVLMTIVALIALLLSTAGNLAVPALSQRIIDQGIAEQSRQTIITLSLIIVSISVLRALVTFLQGYLTAKVSQGVAYDLRKDAPYSSYDDFDFQVPIGDYGDAYDRYLVRMEEFIQSTRIIEQAIENLPQGPIQTDNPLVAIPDLNAVQQDAGAMIRRFKIGSDGPPLPFGENYFAVEGAKGELGFYLVGNGTSKPYRLKIRSPGYYLISALPRMIEGHMIADVITLIGSIDIVLGEVDR